MIDGKKDMILYNKSTNLNCLDDFAGSKVSNAGKIHKIKHLDPPSVGWLKWNTDASRIRAKCISTISYACKDSKGCILFTNGKNLGIVTFLW